MQVSTSRKDLREKLHGLVGGHPPRFSVQPVAEGLPLDELHDDPALLMLVKPDVVNSDKVCVAQVQAMAHASHFDIEVLLDSLESDLFARIAFGKIDLSESTHPDSSLDGVTVKGAFATAILKFHGVTRGVRRLFRMALEHRKHVPLSIPDLVYCGSSRQGVEFYRTYSKGLLNVLTSFSIPAAGTWMKNLFQSH
jgi:hypothetical protein